MGIKLFADCQNLMLLIYNKHILPVLHAQDATGYNTFLKYYVCVFGGSPMLCVNVNLQACDRFPLSYIRGFSVLCVVF